MLDEGMLEGAMIFGLLLLKEWQIEQSTYLQKIYTTKSRSTIKTHYCDTFTLAHLLKELPTECIDRSTQLM
jgi:hypothetical protein